jgi:hypothetical protein
VTNARNAHYGIKDQTALGNAAYAVRGITMLKRHKQSESWQLEKKNEIEEANAYREIPIR